MLGRVQPKALEGFSSQLIGGLGGRRGAFLAYIPSGRKIMVLAVELFGGLDM